MRGMEILLVCKCALFIAGKKKNHPAIIVYANFVFNNNKNNGRSMCILILLFAGCFLINVYKTYNIFPVVDLNVQVSGITLYLDRRFSLRNKYAISKSK